MDSNAQSQSVQQASEQPIHQATQAVSDDQGAQSANPVPQQQVARTVENPKQPTAVSSHPEQGPITAYQANEDYDDDDDEQPVAKQEVSTVKMAHPEVVLPQEVKDAGATEGADAKKEDLPEEHQQVEETVASADGVQVTTQQVGDDPTIPMSMGEAQLAVKKERSIKNGISWIVRMVIREWKKRLFKQTESPEEKQIIK